jgi:hypothetical protein
MMSEICFAKIFSHFVENGPTTWRKVLLKKIQNFLGRKLWNCPKFGKFKQISSFLLRKSLNLNSSFLQVTKIKQDSWFFIFMFVLYSNLAKSSCDQSPIWMQHPKIEKKTIDDKYVIT